MNKYVKEFLHRGLIFGGFGPIVMGIVYLILSYTIKDFTADGNQIFGAIISTYMLAFVQAGTSVFNMVEHWSVMKALLLQLASLYTVYILAYVLNSWIPFNFVVIIIFTVIFMVIYFVIWLIVFLCVKATSKKLSKKIL